MYRRKKKINFKLYLKITAIVLIIIFLLTVINITFNNNDNKTKNYDFTDLTTNTQGKCTNICNNICPDKSEEIETFVEGGRCRCKCSNNFQAIFGIKG